ncbi:MAG: TonB-dependent receptor, partial [Bacteroidetes bacterium]|nr:TonB-dependent receptor [Bacteroidota bacterium]
MKLKYIYISFIIQVIAVSAFAQNPAIIFGKITDFKNNPIELVTVSLQGQTQRTVSDKHGYFEFQVPSNKNICVFLSFIGYKTDTLFLNLNSGEKKEINCLLYSSYTTLPNVDIIENRNVTNNFTKIDVRTANVIPSASGGIEALIKTMPGVSSNNELSSQYSVRGGNFDENLVYVNDIEIYRPFLVRSGQQEGLSFINSDLVSGINFSAGGFDAKYGDKMSSVLDIQYKKPIEFAGSVSGSLLGYSAHLEGVSNNSRFTYLIGARQKSNQYLLKSLETKGDYKPSFTDVQTDLVYLVNEKFNIEFLGNYASNVYKVIPQTRQTDFGTLNDALRLTIYFDGQEVDKFQTYFGAFSGNFKPKKNVNLKFIASSFQTNESETFDIQGQYWLDQLETNFGGDQFGNVAFNMGVGTFLNHARNYLDATVFNAEHKGTVINEKLIQYWGVRYQRELINDRLNEWQMIDSADYSLPHSADSVGYINPSAQIYYPLQMNDVVKANISLASNRYSGYYEQKWLFDRDSSIFSLTTGVRANY